MQRSDSTSAAAWTDLACFAATTVRYGKANQQLRPIRRIGGVRLRRQNLRTRSLAALASLAFTWLGGCPTRAITPDIANPSFMTVSRRPTWTAVLSQLTVLCIALVASGALSGYGAEPKARSRRLPLAVLPSEVPSPAENPTTAEKVALGRRLFFDARLSGDNAMSCATCHLPSKAWTDGLPLAKGREGATLSRNTPALLNLAFFERYMWDGRANSLEAQALLPIQSPAEMHQDLDELVRELNAISGYVEQFHSAFGSGATRENVAQALAAFQRTLVTGETPLDRYLRGDRRALSEAARRGLELFLGEAGCIRCHHGPLLSDGRFYRLGVTFDDPGLAAVSGDREDWGKFRTPSLRNVADTGPYMHNGSLKSLEEVVTFYYRGVPTVAAGEPALDIKPLLGRSFSEIPDLVSFLEALSGDLPVVSTPELP